MQTAVTILGVLAAACALLLLWLLWLAVRVVRRMMAPPGRHALRPRPECSCERAWTGEDVGPSPGCPLHDPMSRNRPSAG